MKKLIAVLLLGASFLYVSCAAAQDDTGEKAPAEMEQVKTAQGGVPVGMETMLVKQTKLVVPIGMKYKKKGDLVVMESPTEYTARRLADMDDRLDKMEEQITQLSAKIEELSKAISQQQKNTVAPAQNKEPPR